ncbi:hypothetical protein [uncultured Gammaproteobacteria bacterium]|nr:hypothetical protein [uncultured Gammaproteobacteria bacterium]
MGWFFRILIGIFWVGWFYFWIWEQLVFFDYYITNFYLTFFHCSTSTIIMCFINYIGVNAGVSFRVVLELF